MTSAPSLIVRALCEPASVAFLDDRHWDLLIRQARRSNLLASLCAWLDQHQSLTRAPSQARNHLESARIVATQHADTVRWEVRCLGKALSGLELPLILLKGAAYVMADLPPGRGRVFYDVDILVPKDRLDEVEGALRKHGWSFIHLDDYDQRYYRAWMHELPPLEHLRRRSVVDVHHRILPETARLKPDARKMLAASQPLETLEGVHVLAPAHMVLHSATHLFHDGDLEQGLRDLFDLDALLRHFAAAPSFWDELIKSAREMDLMRPVYYALRHTRRVFDTPVPSWVIVASEQAAPNFFHNLCMDGLFKRALTPHHDSCNDNWSGLARWLLYVRSHYLRMPLYLLIPHLVRKALTRQNKP